MENFFPNRQEINPKNNLGFSNKKATGKLPTPLPSPLLLNLGCGKDFREGFINIDLFSDDERVVYMDIRSLEFEDNSVDLILASDILEHFSHREIDSILTEWSRVLKPNGEIIIRSPSLKLQTKAYLTGVWNADIASYMIFGGQTNPGDYHCVAFDQSSINFHLQKAGLQLYSYEEQDIPQDKGYINLNFIAYAKKVANINENDNEENINLLKELVYSDKRRSKNQEQLNIVWEGTQFVYHSLALVNREHCLNIINSKVANLTIIPYEPDKFSPSDNPNFNKLLENDIRFKEPVAEEVEKLPYVWIRHQWPPKDEIPQGAKWIIMQPWEFSQIRKDMLAIFQKADQIWCPSNFTRQAYLDSGIEFNKVQIVPNGINPELFKPYGDKFHLNTNKKIKLLFCGGTIYRKGIDILLESYIQSFTIDDDICLVIKDMGGDSFYQGQTFEKHIAEVMNKPNTPEIIYIKEMMTETEIASLYRECNVFVSPYRGEGFSLPTLEAMASGLPVIVTEGGATEDFVLDEFSWKIEAEPKSIGNKIDNKELTGEAYILEPSIEDLSEILKSVYKNPSVLFSKGLIASFFARKYWTWRRASLKMLSILDGLYGTSMGSAAQNNLPEFEDAYIKLGEIENHFINSNYEDVINSGRVLLNESNLNPKETAHLHKRIIQSLIYSNKIEEAKVELHNFQKIFVNDNDALLLEVLLYGIEGKSTEGLEILSKLMDDWKNYKYISTIGTTLDDLLTLTGDFLLSTKENYFEAIDVYELALKENQGNAQACYGAALCLYNLGFPDKAMTMIDWAVELQPNFNEASNFKLFLEEEFGKE
jgi:glycosyltransferase involved in cell wall biosynthesis